MSVKIKSLGEPKKMIERTCNICGKKRLMSPMERFCSPICRQQATDVGKFGNEYRVSVRK